MSVHPYRRSTLGRINRIGWAFLMLVGLALIVVLFFIKTRALEARAEVRQLQRVLDASQASVKMLEVEIAHLESPARIRQLSESYLDLHPVDAERVLTMDEAASSFAKEKPAPDNSAGEP